MFPFDPSAALLLAVATASPAPQAPGAPSGYRSALDDHARYAAVQPVPWALANETVGRIGGWRAYARESRQPGTARPH